MKNKESKIVGKKYDEEKAQWHLLPIEQVSKIVDVLTHGAQKYGPENWKNLADFENRYYAAAMRHLVAWRSGEQFDESGLSHLAHATTNLVFLMWSEDRKSKMKL